MAKQTRLKLFDDESPLAEKIAEHPAFLWLHENSRTLLYAVFGLALVLLGIYRWSAGGAIQAEREYAAAFAEYAAFAGNSPLSSSKQTQDEALDNLEAILKNQPNLAPNYDGPIAQTLLIRADAKKAAPFAEAVFVRTAQNSVPYFIDYGKDSLTIAQGDLPKTLARTVELKDKMLSDNKLTEYPYLYAYLLFRIAMLEQLLNHPGEELAAWHNLKEFLQLGKSSEPVDLQPFIDNFGTESKSLLNYIETREAQAR